MEYKTKKELIWEQTGCPKTGSFFAYKKAIKANSDIDSPPTICIVVLEIPEDAARVSPNVITFIKSKDKELSITRKCRASKAKVFRIEYLNGSKAPFNKAASMYIEDGCLYTVGEMVYPDNFDDNPEKTCSHGIHFFMKREDAVEY